MTKPDAAAVAKTLQELAQRMELEGGNPYRARAYARAAENLSLSPEPLDRLIKEGRLTEIPGIGDAIAAVITKLHQTGQHAKLDAMRDKAPEGVLSMLRIPGLRPDRVRKLYTDPTPCYLLARIQRSGGHLHESLEVGSHRTYDVDAA